MRAYIVVDLGFGDAGKGILTDFLVRHTGAGVVVRYNGGAQAGHNVVTADGRHHTFAQFGSGTFVPGVKTLLSRHMVVHPTALLVEGEHLQKIGVRDAYERIRISDQALIITPFHQAANRIRELARAENRHGSCGVGVGEVVVDAQRRGEDSIRGGDLSNPALLRWKLRLVRERKRAELVELIKDRSPGGNITREWQIFEREDLIDNWIAATVRITELGLISPDSLLQHWLAQTGTAIFEGAQGLLLDGDRGFHPYTTWSRCTAENAYDLLQELSPGSAAFQIGVMRAYAVRHGPGPLPTETGDLGSEVFEHNGRNPWQGSVRYGWFDAVLVRYALSLTGALDSLLVTHMDVLPRLEKWRFCRGYKAPENFAGNYLDAPWSDEGLLTDLHLSADLSLAQRARFTRSLSRVTPLLEDCEPDEHTVIRQIEALTGQAVGMISRGPGAADVQMLNALPA